MHEQDTTKQVRIFGELVRNNNTLPVVSSDGVYHYSTDPVTNNVVTRTQAAINTELYTISEGKADKSELTEAIDAINESIATLPGSFDVYSANVGDTIPEGATLTWDGAPVETRIAEVNETKTLMVACARTKENNADWPNPKQVRLLTFVLGHSLVATSAANGAKPFNGFQDEDIAVAQTGYNGTPQEIYFNTVKGCFVGKTGNAIQGYTYYNSWSNDADYRNNAASNVFVYTNGQVARYYRYVENGGYVMGNITDFSQLSADLKEVWGGAQVDISGKADKSYVDGQLSGKANKSEMSITPGTGANADKTTIQLKSGTSATVLTQHQDISGKVDVVDGKGLSTNDYTNTDKQAVATIGNKANTSDVYPKTNTYNKTEVDNKVDVAVAGAAFLGDEEGEASVADFNPRTDTLWKKEQLLTNTEKAAVKSNLGITQDLAEMRSEIDAQKTTVSMLDGHDVVVVDTLPTNASPAITPNTDKIYRLVITDGSDVSYEDYMYTEATTSAIPKKIATYAIPGVDEKPTDRSDKLVKSGGVYNAINLFSHPLANRVIKELYVPNVDYTAFTKITFWLCYLANGRYWNVIRLFVSNEDYFYLYTKSFDTEAKALADMANNMNGLYESDGRYVILSVSPDLAGTNIVKADFTINRDIANLNNSPVIKESLDKVSLEASMVGKEVLANKVSVWSPIPTDAHYPSEKLVHDTIFTPLNSVSKTMKSGSKNLYNYENTGVLSGVIQTTGTVTQLLNGFYTEKIRVEPNHYYYLSNRSKGVAMAVRCLDANNNKMKVLAPSNGEEYSNYYLPNVDATNSALNGQFKTPANAAYIQINLTPLNVTEIGNYYQIMLEDVGDAYNPNFVPSEYEPYNYTTIIKDASLQYPVKPLADKVEALADNSTITVKLLCVGSSFTQDEFGYLPFILNSIAPNVKLTIGIAYIGGSPLPQHFAYLTHADSEHRIESDGVAYWVEDGVSKPYKKLNITNSELTEYSGYILYKSVNTEPWSSVGSMLIEDVLTNEDWDIVTYQGAAAQAFKSWDDYYAPYIFDIVKQVNAKVGGNIKLAYNLIHSGYASSDDAFLSRWLETAKNAKKVLQQTGFSLLFPSGTAVQNLRCIDALRAMGDGTHHNLLADTAHLQDGIGPLCTAYANALTLLKALGIDYEGVIGEGTRPDAAWVTNNNIPGRNIGSGVIGITDDYCLLAQIAATNAVKYPYSIINPSVSAPYTDRDTGNKLGISKNELSTDVQASLNKADNAYQKPVTGIPSTDLASGVIPDVSSFITASVNNLTNYYLKSETYTKAEVDALIAELRAELVTNQ